MADTKDTQAIIESDVLDVQKQQAELAQLQQALNDNPEFTRFMELNKAVNTKMAEVRKHIEGVMIPAYVVGKIDKKIEGDWGFVTIKEDTVLDTNLAELPNKFIKKVADTTKIRKTLDLEGKPIKGVTATKRYGIMLKIKGTK